MGTEVRPAPHPPADLAWLAALRQPRLCLAWDLDRWQQVLRLARRLRLLGRLSHAVIDAGLLDEVPKPVARHLLAEQRYAGWRCNELRWTLERCAPAFQGAPYPVLLLKGAAYIAQGLAIGHGRLPSDIDLLVPVDHLADAQARLIDAGWAEAALDPHDERYYREWSHELPPMQHPQHGLELDLHHNILPPVARTRVDAQALVRLARPIPGSPWWVLQPVDQVLHSAAHLFHDAEHNDRVRDLVDIDALIRQEAADPHFWPALVQRATALSLQQPLALALHFCSRWLQTPPPAQADDAARLPRLRWHERGLLVPLLGRVLKPATLDDRPGAIDRGCQLVLTARYHRWRMPMRMLASHAWHKARRPR